MKNSINRLRLIALTVTSCVLSGFLHAQIVVSPVEGSRQTDAPGFYYALPRHVIKVDLVVKKTQRMKGPYSDFTSRTLGVDDFIQQDETVYQIVDAVISTTTESDPDAWFFVEFDEKGSKDARSLVFELQQNGVILAVDDLPAERAVSSERIEKTLVSAGSEQHFQYYAERNIYQRIDTIVRKITIDTMVIRRNVLQSAWVDRSPEQKARAAADFIQQIRENRFNLLIGFQEVNYGTGLAYMDQQLQKLEQEYLSLFLGAETHTLFEHSLYFYPAKDSKGIQNIGKFSELSGFTNENMKGDPVQLVVEPLNQSLKVKEETKNNGKSRLTNGVYYRIPEAAELTVMYKGQVITTSRAVIGQMGATAVLPVNKTRAIFDPKTGMATTIKRE